MLSSHDVRSKGQNIERNKSSQDNQFVKLNNDKNASHDAGNQTSIHKATKAMTGVTDPLQDNAERDTVGRIGSYKMGQL